MHTVAIAMDKGGVGKSTLTLNLAVGLAQRGQRVLLVDADPQGSITDNLLPGLVPDAPGASEYLTASLEEEGVSREEIIASLPEPYVVREERLFLLPATAKLRDVEFRKEEALYWRLRASLALIADKFDICLIDNRGALGPLTICALVATDFVIIPIEGDVLSTQKLPPLLKTIDIVKTRYGNSTLKILGIVLNKIDIRTTLSKEIIDLVRQSYQGEVFDTRIPLYTRIREAIGHGKGISEYDVDSKNRPGPAARAYDEFVNEFLRRLTHAA
jgi:chromosome partitioning protein